MAVTPATSQKMVCPLEGCQGFLRYRAVMINIGAEIVGAIIAASATMRHYIQCCNQLQPDARCRAPPSSCDFNSLCGRNCCEIHGSDLQASRYSRGQRHPCYWNHLSS